MNILAFNYEYPPVGGGGGAVFQQIVEELAERHRITVVTSAFKGLAARESVKGLEIYRVPVLLRTQSNAASLVSMLSYCPSSWLCARRLIRDVKYDIVNSHFVVPSSPSAALVARKCRIPHVISLHGGDLYDPSKRLSPHRLPVVRTLVRRLLRRADRLVAQSTDTARNARELYGVDRQIEVIPLGIRPAPCEAAQRAGLDIAEDRFVMVTVGRLVARKGIEDLLRVLQDLDDPRDLLIVVGDGPKRSEWESLARDLGISERVRFTGQIDDGEKWRLLRAADVYVSTTRHEGFGLVYLEGMDCGLPVVTYDRGGQTDFLEDGKTGALVPAGRRDLFAAALRQMKESPERREICAAYNAKLVKGFYIQACAERYERVFEAVLEESGGARPSGESSLSDHLSASRSGVER